MSYQQNEMAATTVPLPVRTAETTPASARTVLRQVPFFGERFDVVFEPYCDSSIQKQFERASGEQFLRWSRPEAYEFEGE